jgi:hypothetical protein
MLNILAGKGLDKAGQLLGFLGLMIQFWVRVISLTQNYRLFLSDFGYGIYPMCKIIDYFYQILGMEYILCAKL